MIAVLEHPPRKPCLCHDGDLIAGVERMRVLAAIPGCTCDVQVRRFQTEGGAVEWHACHVWGCDRALCKGRVEVQS